MDVHESDIDLHYRYPVVQFRSHEALWQQAISIEDHLAHCSDCLSLHDSSVDHLCSQRKHRSILDKIGGSCFHNSLDGRGIGGPGDRIFLDIFLDKDSGITRSDSTQEIVFGKQQGSGNRLAFMQNQCDPLCNHGRMALSRCIEHSDEPRG
jgi:hypothetical protein